MKTIKQYQLEAAVINDALSFSDEIIKSMENLGTQWHKHFSLYCDYSKPYIG